MSKPNMYCGECPYWLAYGEPETTDEQNEAILVHCAECDFDPDAVEELCKVMHVAKVERDDYDPYTGKYAFYPPMTDEEFAKAYKDYMDEYRADDDDISDEEYEAVAQEAHDNLVRSLIEAGGEIDSLKNDKCRLVYALKEAVEWLNYFLTTERDDIYYDEANGARCRAEYLLMELEE